MFSNLLKYANHMNFRVPRRKMHKKEGLNKINLPSYCFRERVSGLQRCHISTWGPFVKLLEGKERCGVAFQTDSWAIMCHNAHNAQNREKLHITVHLNIPSQHSKTREIKLNRVKLFSVMARPWSVPGWGGGCSKSVREKWVHQSGTTGAKYLDHKHKKVSLTRGPINPQWWQCYSSLLVLCP